VTRRVPFLNLAAVNARDQAAIERALLGVARSGRYLHGPQVEGFEHDWAHFVGVPHCVAVANGLDALRLTLRAWISLGRLAPGDEVIVPANTFIASALAVTDAGLALRLCDVDPRTYNMTLETLQAAITPATRAVMPVHLYGQLADIERIGSQCRAAGLLVLEDAAQAHGASLDGRIAGSFGDAAAFSFYPSKNLGALGDAGAVVTADVELAERVRTLANYGARERHHHDLPGFNSRMDEVQGAVLRVKLARLAADNAARRAIAARYENHLAHADVTTPAHPAHPDAHVWHLYVVRTGSRDDLIEHLRRHGIESSIHYRHTIDEHGAYAGAGFASQPVCRAAARRVVSLPMGPALPPDDCARVIDAIMAWQPDAHGHG
jgi:dTDP-4-amino-4,6-dideoxygalactose transaminase